MINNDPKTLPKTHRCENMSVEEAMQMLSSKKYEIIVVVLNDEVTYKKVKELGDRTFGVLSQCVCYSKVKSQLDKEFKIKTYCENLCLKINAKLGGSNQSDDFCEK